MPPDLQLFYAAEVAKHDAEVALKAWPAFVKDACLHIHDHRYMKDNGEKIYEEILNPARTRGSRAELALSYIIHQVGDCKARPTEVEELLSKLVPALCPFDTLTRLAAALEKSSPSFLSDVNMAPLRFFISISSVLHQAFGSEITPRMKDLLVDPLDKFLSRFERYAKLVLAPSLAIYHEKRAKAAKPVIQMVPKPDTFESLAEDLKIFRIDKDELTHQREAGLIQRCFALLATQALRGSATVSSSSVLQNFAIRFFAFTERIWKKVFESDVASLFYGTLRDVVTCAKSCVDFLDTNRYADVSKELQHALYLFNSSRGFCAMCGSNAKSKCAKCSYCRFCSPACQKAAWPLHKVYCGTLTYEQMVARLIQKPPWFDILNNWQS